MEKKKYIRPAITVYNITPSVILAGSSIGYASEEDYGRLTGGEYYGDSRIFFLTTGHGATESIFLSFLKIQRIKKLRGSVVFI